MRPICIPLLLALSAHGQGLAAIASVGNALWNPGVSFSPVSGSYTGTQTVAISCPHLNEDAWYRTDGMPATPADTLYTGPFGVSASETITAVCAIPGVTNIPLTSSTNWKVNCAASSPQTQGSFTCQSTGGVSSNPLSAWSFSVSGGIATQTATTTYSGAGDAGLLVICCQNGSPPTCNSCTTLDQRIAFTESSTPSAALENSEFDMQGNTDFGAFTKIIDQASSQCQGSSGDIELNASGAWVRVTITCLIKNIDMNVGTHMVLPGTYNCPASNTYGCLSFDYIIDNQAGKLYAPVSKYGTAIYPLTQQSSYSYFAASGQTQQDIWNTTTAGGSPAGSTRTITTYVVTATKGISSHGAANYIIN